MKCAVAVIRSVRGSSVPRSKVTVNHAGTLLFRNETIATRRVRRRTCAFVMRPRQIGVGCGNGGVAERVQPSHRRVPMTVAEAPPRMV